LAEGVSEKMSAEPLSDMDLTHLSGKVALARVAFLGCVIGCNVRHGGMWLEKEKDQKEK
jgi:hypothetical protein